MNPRTREKVHVENETLRRMYRDSEIVERAKESRKVAKREN